MLVQTSIFSLQNSLMKKQDTSMINRSIEILTSKLIKIKKPLTNENLFLLLVAFRASIFSRKITIEVRKEKSSSFQAKPKKLILPQCVKKFSKSSENLMNYGLVVLIHVRVVVTHMICLFITDSRSKGWFALSFGLSKKVRWITQLWPVILRELSRY